MICATGRDVDVWLYFDLIRLLQTALQTYEPSVPSEPVCRARQLPPVAVHTD